MTVTDKTLTGNGLKVHDDFPLTAYETVYEYVRANKPEAQLYEHFAGAWNAVAYRFQAVVNHGDAFVTSIEAHGSTPPPQERYTQEQILFDFFNAGFSTIEATFYGLYSIGAILSPTHFSLKSEKDQQRVSPTYARDAFERAFPSDPILDVFQVLFADPEYHKWREIRNILTHRTAPGRRIYVSIGIDDTPSTEWKLNNIPLDASIASKGRRELVRVLGDLLNGSAIFTSARLPKK